MMRCENCDSYRMFDSAYGHCTRFPPKEIRIKWFPIQYICEYPLVPFDTITCGEFTPRTRKEGDK